MQLGGSLFCFSTLLKFIESSSVCTFLCLFCPSASLRPQSLPCPLSKSIHLFLCPLVFLGFVPTCVADALPLLSSPSLFSPLNPSLSADQHPFQVSCFPPALFLFVAKVNLLTTRLTHVLHTSSAPPPRSLSSQWLRLNQHQQQQRHGRREYGRSCDLIPDDGTAMEECVEGQRPVGGEVGLLPLEYPRSALVGAARGGHMKV